MEVQQLVCPVHSLLNFHCLLAGVYFPVGMSRITENQLEIYFKLYFIFVRLFITKRLHDRNKQKKNLDQKQILQLICNSILM